MTISSRALAGVTAALVAAMGATTAVAAPAASTRPAELEALELNVGYIDTSINGAGVIAVAEHLELWDKYGLDVELIPFTNGPTQIQAMQSGDIDVGYIGGGAVWLPASGQATIIAPSELSNGDVVIASADSGATSMEDLAGMSIGVPEGGAGELMLSLALTSAGMTDEDIEKVVLDPPSIVTAFVSGQIDAAAIFSPLSNQIFEAKPDSVVVAENSDYPETPFLGAWVASNPAVEEKQGALVRFLAVYAEANDFRIEDTATTVEVTAEMTGVPIEQVQGQSEVSIWTPSEEILANNADGTTFGYYESFEEVFVTVGRLEAAVPAEDFVNVDLFAQAMELVAGE